MHNLHYSAVLNKLEQQVTVITPNNRLAKTLIEDYLQQTHLSVLEKPSCLSYDTFLQHLYHNLLHHHPHVNHPVLLTKQQTLYLWQQQMTQTDSSINQGLIHEAYQAWSRCQLWQINRQHPEFDMTQQTQQFVIWSKLFEHQLQQMNVITNEMIVPYLLSKPAAALPNTIIWFCFDETTPQQQALQQFFATNQVQNETLDLAVHSSTQQILAAPDDNEEIQSLIQWLQSQLRNPDKVPRIGVIVPDLNQKASQLHRVLSQHFPKEVVNISLGNNLMDYPIIAHAMHFLRLGPKPLTKEEACLLLHSPFIFGAIDEFIARSQFLQDSPLLQERMIDHHIVITALAKQAPLLAERLTTLSHYPRQASPQIWANLFQTRLGLLGFPGERPLDSSNYQCYQRLLQLFDEFKQLTLLTDSMTDKEAIQTFQALATNTIFQPEKIASAPIQILGLLEAAGCQFDAIWISGLTDECLPQKTKFSAFIPIALQKKYGLPYTSPEKEYQLANMTLSRFKQAASQIILSYAKHTDDKANLPSPLIQDLTATLVLDVNSTSIQQQIKQTRPVEETYIIPLAHLPHQGSTALLSNQAKCPFRAFAAHRLHLKPKPETNDGPNARERGTLIHRIMEIFWSQIGTQQVLLALDETTLAQSIDHAIEEAIKPLQQLRRHSFTRLIQQVEKKRLTQLVQAL